RGEERLLLGESIPLHIADEAAAREQALDPTCSARASASACSRPCSATATRARPAATRGSRTRPSSTQFGLDVDPVWIQRETGRKGTGKIRKLWWRRRESNPGPNGFQPTRLRA